MTTAKRGNLNGLFSGFRHRDTLFVFSDGERWLQDEHRYVDHTAHSPAATIEEEMGTYYLSVDGLEDRVRVRRA